MAPVVALAELAGLPACSAAADVRAAARDALTELCPPPLGADGNPDPDAPGIMEFEADDADAPAKFGGAVLLMAVRDGAESLHFRPQRAGNELTYVVAGTTYGLVPPPAALAAALLDLARTRFAGGRRGGLLARLGRRGGSRADCGTVAFELAGHVVLWDAVAWRTGERAGVDLYWASARRMD